MGRPPWCGTVARSLPTNQADAGNISAPRLHPLETVGTPAQVRPDRRRIPPCPQFRPIIRTWRTALILTGMRFLETVLKGAFVIEPDPYQDERGLFARTFCEREFAGQGLAAKFVQCSTSLTRLSGTVRGLHYQLPPVAEVKLVRCTAGAIFDVIVDLRPESPTFGRHLAMEL